MQQMNIDLTVKQFFEDVEKYIAKMRSLYVEEAAKREFDNMFIKYTELKKQIEYAVKLPDCYPEYLEALLGQNCLLSHILVITAYIVHFVM